MRFSTALPADPAQRLKNLRANLGDELKHAQEWFDNAVDVTDRRKARAELSRVEAEITSLN